MGSSSSISVASEEYQKNLHPNMKKKYMVQRTPVGIEFRNSATPTLKPIGKRSKISNQISSEGPLISNMEIDRLRKEFEMFKLNTENEFVNQEKVKKKYETENQRLRGELQALEKMVSKLKLERDQAVEAEMRALKRASAFELDRNKIQKQFKIYRETREAELQGMLKTIKDQEASSKRILENSLPSKCDHMQLHSDSSKNELKKWSSVESETSNDSSFLSHQHHNTLKMNNSLMMLMDLDDAVMTTGSGDEIRNTDSTKSVQPLFNNVVLEEIVIYITAAAGMDSIISEFVKFLPILENQSQRYGKILNVMYSIYDGTESNEISLHSVKCKLISRSTIFVTIFGEGNNYLLKEETLYYHSVDLAQKLMKCALLLESSVHNEELNSEIRNSFSVIKYESSEKIPGLLFYFLTKKLENYFKELTLKYEHPMAKMSTEEYEVGTCHLQSYGIAVDIYEAASQWSLFLNRLCLPVDVIPEKYLNYLTTYVMQPGPLSPLLVMGTNGSGRSTLLAKWIVQMQEHFLVLHHSVISKTSSTSNPLLMMRKFLIQILEKINSSYIISSNPVNTKSEFLYGLEKVASKADLSIIIVLDSIDVGQNVEEELSWLLDPLPINVRIVISANAQHCPSSWRPWPTLYLEYPCQVTIKSILNHYCSQMKTKLSADIQMRILKKLYSLESSLTLLFVDVLCRVVTNIADEDVFPSLLESILECNAAEELFVVILDDLHAQLSELDYNSSCHILGAICISYEGLRLSDLPFIIPSFKWEWWDSIMEKLIFYQIICNSYGLLMIEHEQARTAIYYFCYQQNKLSVNEMQEQLIKYYQISEDSLNIVSDHLVNELPKLLKELGTKSRLKICCSNIWIFYSLYYRGRTCELEEYYKFIEIDIIDMVSIYMNHLNRLENLMSFKEDIITCNRVANLYEALGHFLQEKQLFSQAVMPLQRTVELRETLLDPDHPLVADALHHLGILQSQWGNYSTALTLHKQALDILEMAFGKEHFLVAMELSCILVIYQHLGKSDMIPILQDRIGEIKKSQFGYCLYQNLSTFLAIPHYIPIIEMTNNAAVNLNEMGVRMFRLHNNILAEKIFLASLKIRRELFGRKSVQSSISLNNLAGIYISIKNFVKAEELYEEALAIRLECLEIDNPLISSSISRLGSLYQRQNKLSELTALYRQLLEIRRNKLKSNHPCIASAMVNLAVILSKQNIYDEALSLYDQALNIFLELYDENNPQVLTTRRNLALLHYKQGHSDIAAELYKKTTEIQISHISFP